MQQRDVIEWVADELVTVVDDTTSVSTPSNHVDLVEEFDEQTYPFVGIRKLASNPQSAGIGNGRLFVDSFTYNDSGVLTSITYRRETRLRIEMIPTTDDDAGLREDLATAIADHFSLLQRRDEYPDDLVNPQVGDGTPQDRREDLVRADGVPLEVTYKRYITDDDPTVAEDVTLDVDVGDTIRDADSDAFQRTV